MGKVIKDCRGTKKCNDDADRSDKENQRQNFRLLLGFKENEIYERKEYSIIKQIKKAFKKQSMIERYKFKKYFIDLYFPMNKMGIETDENGHTGRSKTKKQKRERTIKNAEITLIRINPVKEGFDIFDETSEIQDFIYKSGVKLGEQSGKNKIVEDLEKTTRLLNN